MALQRLFGIVDDAAVAGTNFDLLAAGSGGDLKAIPDASIFWPVTGGTFEANDETLGREDEVRGRRAATAPMPFRAAPVMTVPGNAYRTIVEKLIKKTLGGVDSIVGTSPAAGVHTIPALGYGSTYLPNFHCQMVRDTLNVKMAAASMNRLALSFPLDGFGTFEAEMWGLYHEHVVEAPPTATYTGVSEVLMLRDAKAYFDPTTSPSAPTGVSGTQIPDLQGFDFTWVNNLARRHYAGRQIAVRTIGTPARTRKVWFPTENRLGSAQDVTFSLQFGSTNAAQEIARDYGQIQKLVVDLVGVPLGTTPAATELVRITIYNGFWTGGGADALSARDDLTTRLEGGAFYSDADANDVKIEIVNDINVAIT